MDANGNLRNILKQQQIFVEVHPVVPEHGLDAASYVSDLTSVFPGLTKVTVPVVVMNECRLSAHRRL
jgi:hypothetical protein